MSLWNWLLPGTFRLAHDHLLASNGDAGAVPNPLWWSEWPRVAPLPLRPAHQRRTLGGEHDARGAREISAGHSRTLRIWNSRGGEDQSLINTPLTHEVLERGIQPPFETGCSGRAPLVCWLYAHSSERNLRPWNLISRLP